MKNRLKILTKGGLYPRRNRFGSKDSEENSSSGSEEDSRERGRGFGRSSIFPKGRAERFRAGAYRRAKFSDEKPGRGDKYDHSKDKDSGEDIGSEVGKLFLPKLSPGNISSTYSSIKDGLKKRLKNIVPYCPDFHTIGVLKDWGQMFKRAWPNFFEMGQKSFDYANGLRKQMAECAKHYVTKQLAKGEGGRDDYEDDDENRSGSDEKFEKRRRNKKIQITKGADGKNRITFTGNNSGEDDSEGYDGKKKKREAKKNAESLSVDFKTKFAEPIAEYFGQLQIGRASCRERV